MMQKIAKKANTRRDKKKQVHTAIEEELEHFQHSSYRDSLHSETLLLNVLLIDIRIQANEKVSFRKNELLGHIAELHYWVSLSLIKA